jgi:malonate-semialdehyde dehydrogenase (acetylating)/methylmalonate-semialdehyde dehydrogenase
MNPPQEQATLAQKPATGTAGTLKIFVGGHWVDSTAKVTGEVRNPATNELLARVPMGGAEDVDRAVQAALKAYPAWRSTPPAIRVRPLFKFRELLEKNYDDIARIVTREHGKTLDESRSSVRRAIDNVEVACGIPSLAGPVARDVASGHRQPYSASPWACSAPSHRRSTPGHGADGSRRTGPRATRSHSPSERAAVADKIELLHDAPASEGVVNPCTRQGRLWTDSDAIRYRRRAFVGALRPWRITSQARRREKASACRRRGQELRAIAPDADMARAASISTESCFGCAGERCLANSVVLAVGDAYDAMRTRLVDEAKKIRVGDGLEPGVSMGPVITAAHREKVLGYIEKGIAEGATLALDGRGYKDPKHPEGYFLGPTIFTDVKPGMVIAEEEIFGPVLCVMKAATFEQGLDRE